MSELLGAPARPIDAYASSMRRDIAPADEARRLADLRERDGFTAFKVRVGRECGHDEDEWPGRTEAVVPAVRDAVGSDARLLVDANSCYTPGRAIEVGRFLEQHGVVHFEEPCPYWELGWTAEVARALDLDVAGGEQDCLLSSWRHIVEQRAVDIVQPDVCYVGGLTRALAVSEMAAEAGLPCVPHSANLSLVTVFALHLLAVVPNAGPYVEYSIEGLDYYPWQDGLFTPPLEVRGRPGDGSGGSRLGRRDRAGVAGRRAAPDDRDLTCECSALERHEGEHLERRAGRASRRSRLPARRNHGRSPAGRGADRRERVSRPRRALRSGRTTTTTGSRSGST